MALNRSKISLTLKSQSKETVKLSTRNDERVNLAVQQIKIVKLHKLKQFKLPEIKGASKSSVWEDNDTSSEKKARVVALTNTSTKIDGKQSIQIDAAQQTLNGFLELPAIAEDSEMDPSSRVREDATGHLLCWGSGEFGQHGHGSKRELAFHEAALEMFCGQQGVGRVKHVACGASHTAVVTDANDLYMWGNGNSGQLGLNDLNPRLEPQKVRLYANQPESPAISGVACGGRHTMVWLENGHVFCFGNNFHAQLGYDFRQKNYKENQNAADDFWDDDDEYMDQYDTTPTLLKILTHRPVAQVACGDKHTVFRFQDGGVACVGNNAHGQIGSGTRDDTLVPKSLETFTQPAVDIAAGAQHSMAVTDAGELYVWGYSKACGSKKDDVLSPVKLVTSRRNVISVAGGGSHSMALTANGSVYTWGCGHEGQLGHGEKVKFLTYPRRVKDRHVNCRCVQIQCGETFSAAITEKGLLYMWGRNSHCITPDKPTSHRVFLPHGVNKNFRGGRLEKVFCGYWHTVALIGRPELLERQGDDSGESETEHIPTPEEVDAIDDLDMFRSDSASDDEFGDYGEEDNNNNDIALPDLGRVDAEMPGYTTENTGHHSLLSRRETSKLDREKTSVSLADFYAPTPDIKNLRTPSPEFYTGNANTKEENMNTDRSIPNTGRSSTLIVQLPVNPVTTYADAACSPMTLTTTSSNKSSSVTTSSRVPSPLLEIVPVKTESRTPSRGILKPEKKHKEFDPIKFEKEKLKISTSPMVSEIVQVSRTSADSFALPRETTVLARRHVDFSEMEEIRLKGSSSKSPEKLSRANRHKDRRGISPLKSPIRETSPDKYLEPISSRSRLRHVDSSLSYKSDSALMESPLFKGTNNGRSVSTTDQKKKPWNANVPDEERPYRHHVPKHLPRKYKQQKHAQSNFGLQISRSETIVTSLQTDAYDSPNRVAQLRRYAAMHNPQATSGRGISDKLRPIKTRQVSIPTGSLDTQGDDVDQLFIGTMERPNKPALVSNASWKDRSSLEHSQTPRKVAGIVKMYIGADDIIGSVENPLYSSFSDGRGYADPLMEGDPFIVQPLLKKKVPELAEDAPLPEISNAQQPRVSFKDRPRRPDIKIQLDTETLDGMFCNTSRTEMVGSRIS